MQTVEVYYDILEAKKDMRDYIRQGWRVHTCTMSYVNNFAIHEQILVVYEKER